MHFIPLFIDNLYFCSPGSDDKKKILSPMSDKYRGEKGEEVVFTSLKDAFVQEVAAIILSHKTGVTLLEKKTGKRNSKLSWNS